MEEAEKPQKSRSNFNTFKMPQKISLYQLVEMPNGTVNMDTLLSVIPKGEVVFKELPDKVFDVEKDKKTLEQLLEDYQKRGVKEIQKYG